MSSEIDSNSSSTESSSMDAEVAETLASMPDEKADAIRFIADYLDRTFTYSEGTVLSVDYRSSLEYCRVDVEQPANTSAINHGLEEAGIDAEIEYVGAAANKFQFTLSFNRSREVTQ